jgi:hypothetical protein
MGESYARRNIKNPESSIQEKPVDSRISIPQDSNKIGVEVFESALEMPFVAKDSRP